MKLLAAGLLLAGLLWACSGDDDEVDWDKYPSGTQSRIDTGTCAENQALFDAFADMDDAVRQREGSGTGDVLGYIDETMKDAGCYE